MGIKAEKSTIRFRTEKSGCGFWDKGQQKGKSDQEAWFRAD